MSRARREVPFVMFTVWDQQPSKARLIHLHLPCSGGSGQRGRETPTPTRCGPRHRRPSTYPIRHQTPQRERETLHLLALLEIDPSTSCNPIKSFTRACVCLCSLTMLSPLPLDHLTFGLTVPRLCVCVCMCVCVGFLNAFH